MGNSFNHGIKVGKMGENCGEKVRGTRGETEGNRGKEWGNQGETSGAMVDKERKKGEGEGKSREEKCRIMRGIMEGQKRKLLEIKVKLEQKMNLPTQYLITSNFAASMSALILFTS